MKTVSLRTSVPVSLVLVLLAGASAAAQTTTGITAAPSLGSQIAPLAGVRTTGTLAPAGAAMPNDDPGSVADQQQPPGPMTIVPVHDAFVFTPEVRFGTINHRSATLVGGTAGLLMDNRVLIGAGGYWLANNHPGFDMGYVGAVIGWYLKGDGPVDLSLTGLVGGGWSTMTYSAYPPTPVGGHSGYGYGPSYWYVGSDFFIAEPAANIVFRVSRSVWVNAGVSYRLISGSYGSDSELRGVTGNVSVTFGAR